VAVVAGIDVNRELYIVEMFRSQCATHIFSEKICELTRRYKPEFVLADNDNATKMYALTLATKSKELGVYVPFYMLPISNRNKEERAAGLRAMFMQNQIKFKQGDWSIPIYEEILAFPSPSVHDDAVDSLSLIARQMNKMSAPTKQTTDEHIQYQMELGANGQVQMTETLDALFKSNESNKLSLINRMRI